MQDFLNSCNKLEFFKVKQRIVRYALSEFGREKILNLQPSSSPSEIQYTLDLTSEMKALLESDDPLPMDGLTDIRPQLSRASILDSIITVGEIYSIGISLQIARKVSSFFSKRKNTYILLNEIVEPIYIDKILEFNIDRAIDENGNIKDTATAELRKIRREIGERTDQLRKKLENILKSVSSQGWAQEEIITARDGRMVIPIKIENKNRLPGFIHSSSSSGATVFIEPTETLELNNDLRTLQFQETKEIERILRDLTTQVRTVKDQLSNNIQILSTLDFFHAKGKYSIEILGCAPKISEKGFSILVDARHPLLLMRHRREEVFPLTLEIGKDYSTLIITGPNAGGKSVAIKTFGLMVLMVQSGLHIPASSESIFNVYSKIFVDIGDDQSIENDLSTFSSHLVSLKEIIERADDKSLVLIDEIGAGTDPTEGSALAQSILEDLTKKKVHTLVTTHHGTLKAFAYETDGIENGAMEFDHETLTPTYRFKSGVPGSSYAFEMAKRMGIARYILDNANSYRGESHHNLENLLAELELRSQQMKVELSSAREANIKLENLISEYTQKNKTIQKEVKEIKAKALHDVKQILDKANSVIEKAIQEIRQQSGSKNSIKFAKDEIQKLREEHVSLLHETEEESSLEDPLQVGDNVKLKGGTEIGKIIERSGTSAFNILFGQLKIKANRSELVKVSLNKKNKYESTIAFSSTDERISPEIDLRGMMGEEAINAIDKYIDSAVLHGLHRIDLIHGKGTGALRVKITEYLKKHSAIKSFRLGDWNEGGHGVTVVELN
jgi:DNA mismatch repair protein MutS2